jgi:UDP-N-acetylmuramate: L-alanyl-gamma-D-glutamyl-meso-diaminopimelate ligase
VMFGTEHHGHLAWDVIGQHNQMNALASIAAARHVGVPVAQSIDALNTFKNVKRRMELRGVVNNISVYDDFAHHPTAIATTVAGLRANVNQARIIAVLEPRSNSMKLGTMNAALPASLVNADFVFCYGGNVDWDIEEALLPIQEKSQVLVDLDALISAVVKIAQPNDHILVMSNGGFGGIHQKLLHTLA